MRRSALSFRLLLAMVALVPALAEAQIRTAREVALRAAIADRGLDPDEVMKPLALTEEMQAWVKDNVARHPEAGERMRLLLRSLLSSKGLGMTYSTGFTGTAHEVFEAREGNCLGFTQMFVVMGREVGVDVYYLAVDRLTRYRKQDDLIIVSDHVTAAFNDGDERRILEFSLAGDFDYRGARQMTDIEALGLYYSNRGAEEIQNRRVREGHELLETAVTLAPKMAQAWVNLGVAHRRLGRQAEAEAAYRRAIEIDEAQLSAYHNLVGLYRLQGKQHPAREILRLLDRRDNRNPFIYLQLGDMSEQRGHRDEARSFYKRAVRLGTEHAETWAALGLWYLEAGDARRANRLLTRAEKRDPEEERTVRLRERLAVNGPR
jgi:Flp pilus assembly protein TadD